SIILYFSLFFASAFLFFFLYYTATTVIYTLSLHDALPICVVKVRRYCFRLEGSVKRSLDVGVLVEEPTCAAQLARFFPLASRVRSEEHTSELQSRSDLVCRLLLEKKK